MATKKEEKQYVKKLVHQIETIEDEIKMGDELFFKYDGNVVAEYQFIEWSADAKSPMDWFRGCMCFEVTLKCGDVTKVEVDYKKNTDPDIFRKLFNL